MAMAEELKKIAEGDDLKAQVINQARQLEGSVRNTGTHACGVIITPVILPITFLFLHPKMPIYWLPNLIIVWLRAREC